jgi:hypothetical protein
MSTSQWRLARMATSEHRVCEANLPFTAQLDLLDRIARQTKPSASAPAPHPSHLMSDATSDATVDHPVFCAPATTDSR